MKIACIISAFDGTEFLDEAMSLVAPFVSHFIVATQSVSYHGNPIAERDMVRIHDAIKKYRAKEVKYEVKKGVKIAGIHEHAKRFASVRSAKDRGATHYFYMDCDELYPEFEQLVAEHKERKAVASAVNIAVYFKRRDLRIEGFEKGTSCPFIAPISTGVAPRGWQGYPFVADPTRMPLCNQVTMLESGCLHHYSWVREDDTSIRSKAANSSVADYIQGSTLLQQYLDPATDEGTFIDHYGAKLIKA